MMAGGEDVWDEQREERQNSGWTYVSGGNGLRWAFGKENGRWTFVSGLRRSRRGSG